MLTALSRIVEIAQRLPRRLMEYHRIGRVIDRLKRGYGKQFFNVLAAELAKRGATELDTCTLRKCLLFSQCVDRATAAPRFTR